MLLHMPPKYQMHQPTYALVNHMPCCNLQYVIYSMESYHIIYVGYINIHIARNTLYIV
jgi:hypothetical protein